MNERQRENVRLQQLRAHLAEQQLLQGMREALDAAIFQLQGPLNILQAAAGLARHAGVNEALGPALEQVLTAGQAALATLRAAVPETTLEHETLININEILHEVIDLSVDRLLASGVVVDWRPLPVLPAVLGCKTPLRGLFKYLLDNAITAIGEVQSTQREVRICTGCQANRLEVIIEDNGVGFPEQLRLKVFEPLFSAWRDKRGHAGMGLAMAQEIARQHGGDIEIEPLVISGCRLRVTLPAAGQTTR